MEKAPAYHVILFDGFKSAVKMIFCKQAVGHTN